MMVFPVRYKFDIVGKTLGDESIRHDYVEQIKTVVFATARDYAMQCQSLPTKGDFTKIELECEVQSAAMINTIYNDLESMERTFSTAEGIQPKRVAPRVSLSSGSNDEGKQRTEGKEGPIIKEDASLEDVDDKDGVDDERRQNHVFDGEKRYSCLCMYRDITTFLTKFSFVVKPC
jgi:putative lipoic acid-binding regulatory protein